MARFLTVNLISLIVTGLFGFPFLFRVTFGNSSPSKNVAVAHRPFNDREPRSDVASRSRYGQFVTSVVAFISHVDACQLRRLSRRTGIWFRRSSLSVFCPILFLL